MLSKFSVRKPFTVFVGVVIILVLGFLSFRNMSTDFLPSMEFPYAIVMTTYAGASPEEVEKAVTEPVEQSMARINNVKAVQSMSINNMSVVMMEFNDGTDMGSTTVDMRENLDMVTAQWDDSIGSPTIMKLNPDMMPIMVAALDYDKLESAEVTKRAKQDIIPELESVEGVASVNESGAVEKKIQVLLQQKKLDKMNEIVQDAIDGKLSDAQEKIDKGKKEIEDGKDKLADGKEKTADKIAKGETKLNSASEQIREGLKTIDENIKQIKEQKKTLEKTEKQVNTGLATVAANKASLQATVKTLQTAKSQMETLQSSLKQLTAQETKTSVFSAVSAKTKVVLAAIVFAVIMAIVVICINTGIINALDANIEKMRAKVQEQQQNYENIANEIMDIENGEGVWGEIIKEFAENQGMVRP